ncbi:hypothetical protein SEA_GANCHO_30 [Mycobacterium phage Gancho]|uniref:Uncharacterized protein n=1 Tax=Mycobacterium phage Gancho TaxID=2301613 RepID=A0A385UHT9_9CAUD|nr:hypothetical protein SEA_GANCHO_30 [Mycobacterium phage Gancho]
MTRTPQRTPPVPPEARCIICGRPAIDHTWRHPATMIDHVLTQLLYRD